jgi:hypothetical protein
MPRPEYDAIFEAAAKEWNVHPQLLRAIAKQESGGNPRAVSPKGATGVMQIMPSTGKELGVTDLTDPTQSIYGGAKYLSQMLDKYGRPELALAAYNAGPGRVDAFIAGRGQLPNETQAYVPAVTGHYRRMTQTVADRRPASDMSVEDFLKATKGGAGAPTDSGTSVDDFLNATKGAATAKPVQTAGAASDDPNVAFVMPQRFQKRAGAPAPVDVGQPIAAVADAVGRVGAAVRRGAAEGSQPLPPLVSPVLEALGVYPPAAGGGTMLQGANKLMINPIATAGEGALRALGGAFRGAQAGVAQTGAEVGQPQLGRDLAAFFEAFMGSAGGVRVPGNKLAPAATNEAALARIADDLSKRMAEDVQGPGRGRFLLDKIVAEIRRVDNEAKPAPQQSVAVDAGGFGPRSVGAAATPEGAAKMSRAEMQAMRSTAERDRLLEPQPRGMDTKEYIPGVQTTEAQMVQTAPAARRAKLLEMEMGEPFKQLSKANNEARGAFIDELAGTPTQKRRLEEARGERATADLEAAWRNKKDVDPSPVTETATAILDSPDGRRPAVRGVVKSVMDEMTGRDRKLITDPEMLYGVRKHIDDLLSNEGAKDTPMAKRATAQLQELKTALDGVIESGSPGFREYLKNFAEASRPIDELTILQEYAPKLRDSQNRITYSAVQRMLKDIVDERGARGVNAAQSISDETINKLFALRDDLRRVASSEELAKARGSDTAQNTLDFVKSLAGKGMAEGAAIAAGGVPGIGSMVMSTITNKLRDRNVRRSIERELTPDRNKLTKPKND